MSLTSLSTPAQSEWAEQLRQQRDAEARQQRLQRAQWLWEASHVPPRYLDADFSAIADDAPADQQKTAERLRQLLDSPGMLAMVGLRGCGKTWMGAALIRDFCRVFKRARYARAMDIFRDIKRTFGKRGESESDIIDDLARPELLVIDEIQVRSESDWENDVLIDLIDARYAALKSTVVIGNLAPGALVKNVGESITSRLQESGGIIVCNWPSYRANGKAKPAAPPIVDPNSGNYQFTPVVEGATPQRPGWASRAYHAG